MRWLRSCALIAFVGALAGVLGPMADPSPPQAQASLPCDIGLAPADAVTGAVGIGNPVGDACDAVTDPVLGVAGDVILDPLKEAAASVGKGVFNKITGWVAEGAVWLVGEVAELSDKTTTPNLLSKGFLKQYRQMATIAAFMAALMLIFAVFESLGRGDPGMLWRVFMVNLPLAALATTAAYVVVQLLVATCDGFCEVVTRSTDEDAKQFFQETIKAIAIVGGGSGAAGGAAAGTVVGGPPGAAVGGAAGAVAVPMFIGFIVTVVAAFAAFFVWLELLMRDAAIYIVALFMPFSIAASIWPRWVSALRRTCELVIVIVFSKFVIVAIIALAASLLAHNEGSVEHILAATVMLLLACFAPFVLFKLVPFAEGAMAAAYNRQSAASGGVRTVEFANSMMMVHRLSRANWGAAGSSASEGGGSGAGGGGGPKPVGGGSGGAGGGGGAAAGAVGAVVGMAVDAAKGTRRAAQRMAGTSVAGAASQSSEGSQTGAGSGADQAEAPPRPAGGTPAAGGRMSQEAQSPSAASSSSSSPARSSGAGSAEPSEAKGGTAPGVGAKPPRPGADGGAGKGKGSK